MQLSLRPPVTRAYLQVASHGSHAAKPFRKNSVHQITSPREIESHTAIRGIAAIAVVLFHYKSYWPALDINGRLLLIGNGYIWVDLFFILSGFILYRVYDTTTGDSFHKTIDFWRARFARIYPLHFATTMILLLLALVVSYYHRAPPNLNYYTLFLNLFLVHAFGMLSAYDWNFPSWSVSAECAAYILFPFGCLCLVRYPRSSEFCFVILIFALLAALIAIDMRENWERFVLLRSIPEFLWGLLLARLPAMRTRAMSALQITSTATMLVGIQFGWNEAIAVLSFAGLVYSTQTDTGFICRCLQTMPIVFLGTISYSLYLLHIPTARIADLLFPKLFGSGEFAPATFVLITLSALLLVSALCFRFFEKPTRDWIRHLGV